MKLIFSSLLVLSVFSSVWALDPKCDPACDRFIDCAKEMHRGKTATPAELKRMKDGCLNTCKKKAKEVISCYDSKQNSCGNFALCIQKSYSATKK